MFERILVVCVGNVCRSPMAEAVLASRLAERGFKASVSSAGIAALVGRPAEPEAQRLMRERGLDISSHRARQLVPEMLRSHELILVMSTGQQRAVDAIDAASRGRVHRIGRWGNFDVPDPYQQDRAAFERALSFIDRGLDDLLNAFWRSRR